MFHVCHLFYLSRGHTRSEAEHGFVNTARKLENYGVDLHGARVRSVDFPLFIFAYVMVLV